MSNPLVSIITVNYNQTEVTCALLESIRRQDYRAIEIIVVDNGSLDDPADVISTRYPEVKFIRSKRNLGFAGGNNLGIRQAGGDYLFFINNDAELQLGCIDRLVNLLQKDPQIGIVSPLIDYFPVNGQTNDVIQYAGMTTLHPITARNHLIGHLEIDKGQFNQPQPTAYAHGAAMMVPRNLLDKIGLMSEKFFLYYEELDWCEQIRRAGFSVWIEPRARVYHKESMTVQKLGALKTYYLNRNRVYFMRRNHQGWNLGLFYLYLGFIAVPKNIVFMAFRGEWANLHAFCAALAWNLGLKKNKWEMQNVDPISSQPKDFFNPLTRTEY